jgi:hypothetical protein
VFRTSLADVGSRSSGGTTRRSTRAAPASSNPTLSPWVCLASLGVLGVRYSGRSILFTMASMILLVNAVVAGMTLAWGLLYQSRRLSLLISRDAPTGGDEYYAA